MPDRDPSKKMFYLNARFFLPPKNNVLHTEMLDFFYPPKKLPFYFSSMIFNTCFLCLLFVDLEGGKFFFNTVREGDSVLFATEDEQVKQTGGHEADQGKDDF